MTKTPKDVYAETVASYDSNGDYDYSSETLDRIRSKGIDPTKPFFVIESKRIVREALPIQLDQIGGTTIGFMVDTMIDSALRRGEELAEIKIDMIDRWPAIVEAFQAAKQKLR